VRSFRCFSHFGWAVCGTFILVAAVVVFPGTSNAQLFPGGPVSTAGALSGTLQQLSAKAADGEYNPADAQDALNHALVDAGIDPQSPVAFQQVEDAMAKLQKIQQQAQQNGNTNQNPSGTGSWYFGKIYHGVKYNTSYPLTNNCRIPQNVTITYPPNIPLAGPQNVEVPAHTKISVPMVLEYPPFPPVPPGGPQPDMLFWPQIGSIESLHRKTQTSRQTAAGTYVYVCHEAQITYKVRVDLFNGPTPEPQGGGGGGGGGGGKKKPGPSDKQQPEQQTASSACTGLWDFNQFTATPEVHSAAECANYIREQAHLLFDTMLQPYRSADPSRWAWVPTGTAIDLLSVQQIMSLKTVVQEDLAAARQATSTL